MAQRPSGVPATLSWGEAYVLTRDFLVRPPDAEKDDVAIFHAILTTLDP